MFKILYTRFTVIICLLRRSRIEGFIRGLRDETQSQVFRDRVYPAANEDDGDQVSETFPQVDVRSFTNQLPSRNVPSSDQAIENIKNLYSPHFPLDVVRDYVMMALNEAVEVNQVHNRDPIGGSNENLFLYVR